ncbi:hypothetical protein [Thiocystis violacea]|uniref:hypothetical protein n=1 Tax=Thiocystis violacea TaxID=13725 RepID=UPI00190722C9|nr:hypothetical protein [Thiocystis violacea]
MSDDLPHPPRALLPATGRALAQVTDRILAVATAAKDEAERERFKALLRRHPEFLVRHLSDYHPLDAELIERLTNRWDRDIEYSYTDPLGQDLFYHQWNMWKNGLSCNKALPWSLDLIERFADRWQWGWPGLSDNPALPWSLDLIERFADRWEWGVLGLSTNPALPWSLDLIERFADRWEWGEYGLSHNPALPWSLDLIERFEDRWDFEGLLFLDLPIWRLLRRQDIIELMDALPALPNQENQPKPSGSTSELTDLEDDFL